MKSKLNIVLWNLLIMVTLNTIAVFGQNSGNGKLNGVVQIDTSWSSDIYLSYIPTFSDITSMSSEMIIADAKIDSLGYFEFDLDFLPNEQRLYRLHISKKQDSKNSLIIGGLNENYLVFIANRNSKIKLKGTSIIPPFKNVVFETQNENNEFQKITNLVFTKDSIASKSGRSKRKFIEERLNEKLLHIADSSTNSLISLYALHKIDFESNHDLKEIFYKSYLKKWSHQDDAYSKDFRKKLPLKEAKNNWLIIIITGIILTVIAYLIGKYNVFTNNPIKKLTVQERKVLDLLKEGATNKEISEEFNIGISTVKSHVSSILTKLNVKSRKEIMNLK
jgi:DNA-binding CsgD family transcriptional regulator